MGIQEINKDLVKVNYRYAVRAIVINGNKILMVHTNKGDYKFPGGGIEKQESHEEALKREVQEETGYILNKIEDNIGTIVQRNIDTFENGSLFEMTSYYYLCEVSKKRRNQNLDEYELKQDFRPVWIEINKAIENNEKVLKKEEKNDWVDRETFVLKQLKLLSSISNNRVWI